MFSEADVAYRYGFETWNRNMNIFGQVIMLLLDDENEEESEEDEEPETSLNLSRSAGIDAERTPREESPRSSSGEHGNEESPDDSAHNESRDTSNDDTELIDEQEQVRFNMLPMFVCCHSSCHLRYRLFNVERKLNWSYPC